MQFPYFPGPGGQTRQYYLLRAAAICHDITFVTLSRPPDQKAIEDLQSIVKQVIIVDQKYSPLPKPSDKDISGMYLIKELFQKAPYEVKKWQARKEIPEFLATLSEESFDLVQVEHSELAHWVDDLFNNTPKLLVLHNVNNVIWKRFFDVAPWGKEKLWNFTQWLNMRKYEKSLAKKFDTYITMSDNDKKLLHKLLPDAKIEVIPNGVDVDYFSPHCEPREENSTVYTGYMGWEPSIDAVVTFCHEIFPALKRAKPGLKFYIVGKNPSHDVAELARDNDVIVTGFVDDVRPYLQRAKIVVVPLRVGGGTRLKILEAMAMGKVVVSTSIGAEGLAVKDGEDILIADNPKSFIDKCNFALTSPSLRKTIANNARAKAVNEYDWAKIGIKLNNIYRTFNPKKGV